MQFNVSLLLREPVGATRHVALEAEPPIHRGDVHLTHTPGGVLVHVRADVVLDASCSRCLAPFGYAASIDFEEIFYQQVDVATGAPLPASGEPDVFLINLNHTIDITEAVRQYSEMAAEMQPLCRPDCPGICPVCGQDLGIATCQCDRTVTDPRWAPLAALKRAQNG